MTRAIEIEVGQDSEIQRRLLAELLSQSSDGPNFQPLSIAQEGLWFVEQLEPGTPVHNLTSGFRLYGRLNMDALRRAVDAMVLRHETLRTVFTSINGEVFRHVLPPTPTHIAVEDLRAVPDPVLERVAYEAACKERCCLFDLQGGPLFRMRLIRLRDEDQILLYTMHHLVSDGWSMGVFIEGLKQFYTVAAEGKSYEPLPLPMQYGAYADWQRSALGDGEIERKLRYWRRKLAGIPQILELPSDRVRSFKQTFDGASCSVPLPSMLQERLATFAQSEQVTLFTVLLTAFFILLHRYSHQEDICVGVPVAGRELLETEALIGFFVNTVVIRDDLAGNPRFRDLLAQTRENLLEAYGNQDVPFDRVVAELNVHRSLAYNPAFQVMMTMLRTPKGEQQFGTLTAIPYVTGSFASRFDLTASIIEAANGTIWCQLEYNTGLFDRIRTERMLEHFQALLTSIVDDPERRIGDLELLTAEELNEITVLNETSVAYPAVCTNELVARQIAETPENIAVTYEDKQLSYAVLNSQVERVASLLRMAGGGPGLRIAICLDRCLEMLVGILAIWRIGSVYVPVNPDDPSRRSDFILEDAEVSLVITTPEIATRCGLRKSCVFIDGGGMQSEVGEWRPDRRDPASPAYIMYTSGSTGTPKGVCISHRSLVNLLCSMRREPGFGADDKLLAVTSPSFDISLLELLLPLISGGQVVIASKSATEDPTKLLQLLRQHRITVIQTTPSRWRLLIEAGWTKANGSVRVWCGGEHLTHDLARQLLARSDEVWNLYGPTETTIWSSASRVEKNSPVVLGKPIGNTQFYVLDQRLQPVPRGVRGELCIGGHGVADGYWAHPELTMEKFVRSPICWPLSPSTSRLYRTGDEVFYRSDGGIEYLGRLDSQRKVRGQRVELGEIEAALREIPGVQHGVALVRENADGDERLVAYVVRVPRIALTLSQLQSALRDRLPDYMIPSITFVDAIPLTTNGKIDRNVLPAPADDKRSVKPVSTNLERQLLSVWQQVLGISEITVTDNFFDLGGHSLLAIRLLAKVEKVFGKRLSVASFLKAQTIGEMATLLEGPVVRKSPLLVEMKPAGRVPPLFIFPGSGGDMLPYAGFSRLLTTEHSVYGLQSVGLDAARRPLESVEEIAEVFLAEIRRVQARGPYQLAGFCIGGLVALEVAHRLLACGQEVALLALIETWPPSWIPVYRRDRLVRRLGAKLRRAPRHFRAMLRLPPSQAIRYLSQRVNMLEDVVPPDPAGDLVRKANYLAASRYVPVPYPGHIVLFVPSDEDINAEDPRLFWGTLADKGHRVVQVSGERARLLTSPHVELLAERVSQELVEAPRLTATG
jgi:amino acid adenylation domain-containing protein